MRAAVCVLAIMICNVASASELVVFGLPLGGKLSKPPSVCKSGRDSNKTLCWLVKPSASSTGVMIGIAVLPDANLPSWAAGHLPEMQVDKTGTLMAIRYGTNEGMWRAQDEIVQSISGRFGAPHRLNSGDVTSSKWEKSGARIEFSCVDKGCFLSLTSAEESLRRDSEKPTKRPSTL